MSKKAMHIIFIIIASAAIIVATVLGCLSGSSKYFLQDVSRIKTSKKVLMLTFDDGPAEADEGILKILNEENVHAVFFETGVNESKDGSTEIMKNIIDDGNWIGSHTFHHDTYLQNTKYLIKDVAASYEMLRNFYNDNYESELGHKFTNKDIPLRFSYLQYYKGMDKLRTELGINRDIAGYIGTDYNETANADDKSIQKYFKDKGWGNYDELKHQQNPSEEYLQHLDIAKKEISKKIILDQYKSHIRAGQILVCHTRAFASYWLKDLIEYCKGEGYSFVGMNPFAKWKDSYYGNVGTL